MGVGDEIMAAAMARRLQRTDPRKVEIVDRTGARRAHEIWQGNPRIAQLDEQGDFQQLVCCGGARPYIADKTETRWIWRDYVCEPGEIYLSWHEREFAKRRMGVGHVLIEPNIKIKASPNKRWPWERWQAVVDQTRGVPWVQCGPPGTRRLNGVMFIETPTFRHACAVLERCDAAVLPEGGLHHAAAALGVPAVVIFGGFISPKQTGYAAHVNLFAGGNGGFGCGSRRYCRHCEDAMARIKPGVVVQALTGLLRKQ